MTCMVTFATQDSSIIIWKWGKPLTLKKIIDLIHFKFSSKKYLINQRELQLYVGYSLKESNDLQSADVVHICDRFWENRPKRGI